MPGPHRNVHYADPLAQERMIVQREEDARVGGFITGAVVGAAGLLVVVVAFVGIVRLIEGLFL